MVVDILSAQGEKVVPDSIARLHAVARNIESLKRLKMKQQTSTSSVGAAQ